MIDHCPKCESKALDHIEPRQGEHEYRCRQCGKISRTIEVPEEHLRSLTLGALASLARKAPAAGPDVGDGDNGP